jgi:Holliday junction DNA helicase RuvA
LSLEALALFWKLIAISGVGPRVGQKIAFAGAVGDVKAAIMAGKVEFLTDIPGIGTKTAQKIILELKGALAGEPASSVDPDALEALLGFGYTRKQAEEALKLLGRA